MPFLDLVHFLWLLVESHNKRNYVPKSQFVLRWRNKTHNQDFRRAFRGQPTNSGPATCWPYQNQGMLLLMNLMESSCKSKKKCHHPQLCARKNRISISPASLKKKKCSPFQGPSGNVPSKAIMITKVCGPGIRHQGWGSWAWGNDSTAGMETFENFHHHMHHHFILFVALKLLFRV